MQGFGTGQVQNRLINRKRLHERRQGFHHGADARPFAGIFGDIGLDHHRIGAGSARLEHGHRTPHAGKPRNVAAGRDNAARAAAHNHRAGRQFRLVAFFHTGIEGIAINMRDSQAEQVRMDHHAPRATSRAAREILSRMMEAIAAKGGHRLTPDPGHGGKTGQQHRVNRALNTRKMRQPLFG